MESELIKKINCYFHDEEAQFFTKRHTFRMKEESDFYKAFFKEKINDTKKQYKILDIGSGTGLVGEALPDGDYQLVCADISTKMLDRAKESLKRRKRGIFSYVVCDAESLPFSSGTFDIVTCNAAMHHFPSIDKFTKEAMRILVPGGTLVISFESNRKFWNNTVLNHIYRLIAKFESFYTKESSNYKAVCNGVNERLMMERVIKEPLSDTEILKYVDTHSPNSGDKIDKTKGFDVNDLLQNMFKGAKARIIYHYTSENRLFAALNKHLFPKDAPQFTLVLEK